MPQVTVFDLSKCRPLALVLASDGVWESVSNREVISAVLSANDGDVATAPLSVLSTLLMDIDGTSDAQTIGAASSNSLDAAGEDSAGSGAVDWKGDLERAQRKRNEFMQTPSDRVVGVALGKVGGSVSVTPTS